MQPPQRILQAGIDIRAGMLTLYFMIPSAVPTNLETLLDMRRASVEREVDDLQIAAVPAPADTLDADFTVTAGSLGGSCAGDGFAAEDDVVGFF